MHRRHVGWNVRDQLTVAGGYYAICFRLQLRVNLQGELHGCSDGDERVRQRIDEHRDHE